MIPIGTPPSTESPRVQEAWAVVQGSDRSEAALERLQALSDGATPDEAEQIAGLIEAFVVDGGAEAP